LLDGLADALTQQIVSGELSPGVQLPGEKTLGGQWGVSRPVVREALALLRERGYLYTVNGSGTFVRHPNVTHIAAALGRHMALTNGMPVAADDLNETRRMIEVESARLAALRAEDTDLALLAQHLDQMRRGCDDRAQYIAADIDFHLALACASKNRLLPLLLQPLVRMIVEGIPNRPHEPRAAQPTAGKAKAASAGLSAHQRLFDAVAGHRSSTAVAAMERSLKPDPHTGFVNDLQFP
jgi:DNA-binding FadR family transcriptional regulator